jgi:hypothetical protein
MNHRSLLLHSCWSTIFDWLNSNLCLNSFENLQNVSFSSPRFPCFQPNYSLQPNTVSPRPSSPYSAAQPNLLTRPRSPPSAQPARVAFSLCVSLMGGARWSSPTSGRTPSRIRAVRALHSAPVAHRRTPFLGPARQGLPRPI